MSNPVTHPRSVAEAADILSRGGICAFATETVYGLGADATDPDAVLKIYQTKSRPRFNPLIVHCASLGMAADLVEFSQRARQLVEAFWPGPLTLVLPLKSEAGIADIVSAGLRTLAVRVPGHKMARELVEALGRPVAAPSANPSGRLSATDARHVREAFADQVPVLDGGKCLAGIESTILDLTGARPLQLRAGAIARDDIARILDQPVPLAEPGDTIAAPGMLKSHYAPNAHLRLAAASPRPGEAFLAFGAEPAHGEPMCNLSPKADVTEAARNLFSMLRALDAVGAKTIAVAPIPETGLGEAINDRLRRAAAPRDLGDPTPV